MESAALEAYRKDIESNADISSRAINETLEKQNLELSSKKLWHEDGPIYFWNTETNETIWEAPSCGYLSLKEQQALSFASGKSQLQAAEKFRKGQDLKKLEEQKKMEAEERAAAEREKMKSRRVVEEIIEEPVVTSGPIIEAPTGPYGRWKTVESKPAKKIDFQLPKQEEYIALSIPVDKPEPPPKIFKEKTITSLSDEESTSSTGFKKRKFSANKNRNVRQRFDND